MLGSDSGDAVSRFYGVGNYNQSNPYANLRTNAGYGDNAGDDLYAD